jgi:hypothetical protein
MRGAAASCTLAEMRHSPIRRTVAVLGGTALFAACAEGSGASHGSDDPSTPLVVDAGCESGLVCQVAACESGAKTTLTGTVYDPSGINALYNVQVFIPGGPSGDDVALPPLSSGVTCETCASTVIDPMRATLTDTSGHFTLTDVPVGDGIPLVIQIGKWRRKFQVDVRKSCDENPIPDRTLTLPKNGKEGDMPQIAVTAGGCDALECLLRGIGVDASEFVVGHGGTGHVHVFNGQGGMFPGAPQGVPPRGPGSAGEDLWSDVAKMMPYDITMLGCECGEYNVNKGGPTDASGPVYDSIHNYVERGGRVFATHYHYTWFKNSTAQDYRSIADWQATGADSEDQLIETSFPKGLAMAQWMLANSASPSIGKVKLTTIADSLKDTHPPAVSWIESPRLPTGEQYSRYFSFNGPIGAAPDKQCGRVVFGDLHLMGVGQIFPDGCPSPGALSAQQKAFEFMFFDLSACVQSDATPPTVTK